MNINLSGIGFGENIGIAADNKDNVSTIGGVLPFDVTYEKAVAYNKGSDKKSEYSNRENMQENLPEKNIVEQMSSDIDSFLSNVTANDMSLYEEMGFAPKEDDLSEVVTVSDRIKVQMALGSDDYRLYGDIDMDMLKQMYGDSGLAYSIANSLSEHNLNVEKENIDKVMLELDKAENLKDIDLNSQLYILDNNLPLTIDNIYKAQYSENSKYLGNMATELSDADWETLKSQVSNNLSEWGLPATDTNFQNAKTLIENKIPVTAENISKMEKMQEFKNDFSSKDWIDSIVTGMSLGVSADTITISSTEEVLDTAKDFVNTIQNVTNEELQDIVKNNYMINMNNMQIAKEKQLSTEGNGEINESIKSEVKADGEASQFGQSQIKLGGEVSQPVESEIKTESYKFTKFNKEVSQPVESEIKTDGVANQHVVGEDSQSVKLDVVQNSKASESVGIEQNPNGEISQLINQDGETSKPVTKQEIKLIKAERSLLEARLMMTSKVSVKMLYQGVDIKLSPLEDLIKEAKLTEDSFANAVFKSTGNAMATEVEKDLFTEAIRAIDELKQAPTFVIGNVAKKEIEFSINSVNAKAAEVTVKLKAASFSYETMMTRPRSDLGDNINKAFRNVDDILQDMDIEANGVNQRAVRILAYNEMEITKESVNTIKSYDAEVNRLIDLMTPKMVCSLINKGVNPLDTEITTLNNELEEISKELPDNTTEKYSEYLWKLQKENSISEEDRQAYIGVFRLLNMVAKGDRRVIGALVNEGSSITMNNLVHALRSNNAKGMNYTIDDETEIVDRVIFDDNSISAQLSGFADNSSDNNRKNDDKEKEPIAHSEKTDNANEESELLRERYESQLISKLSEEITPHRLSKVMKQGNIFGMTIEELLERVQSEPKDDNTEYYNEQLEEIENSLRNVSEDVLKYLLDSGQNPTIDNVMVAQMIMNGSGKVFDKLRQIDENEESDDEEQKSETEILAEFDDSPERLKECYQNIENKIKGININSDNFREILSLKKSITMMKSMSKNEMYHVPIEIEGETANVRVTVINGGTEKGKVTADVYSEIFGKISASFDVKGNNIKGMIVCDNEDVASELEGFLSEIEKSFNDAGFEVSGVNGSYSSRINYSEVAGEREEGVSNRSLYKVARIFIVDMKSFVTMKVAK